VRISTTKQVYLRRFATSSSYLVKHDGIVHWLTCCEGAAGVLVADAAAAAAMALKDARSNAAQHDQTQPAQCRVTTHTDKKGEVWLQLQSNGAAAAAPM
jgi:hypothetical protein